MKNREMKAGLASVWLCAFLLGPGAAQAVWRAGEGASVVKLGGCGYDEATGEVENNCFEQVNELLAWMRDVRRPPAGGALLVNVAGQTFSTGSGRIDEFKMTCDPGSGYSGGVSFIGDRQGGSTFAGGTVGHALEVTHCDGLTFENILITASGDSGGGIRWLGGGRSTWRNVTVDAPYYGWTDGGVAINPGIHYWYNSRIIGRASYTGTAYNTHAQENWFFGSEITLLADCSSPWVNSVYSALGVDSGETHVYGSVIRALATCRVTGNDPLTAVRTIGGDVHIHGTGIDVISTVPNTLVALNATGGMIHANATAYTMKTPSGSVTRIATSGTGHVHAPYQWEHIPDPDDNPATASNFTSVNGADTAMVTQGTSDGHPHMAVYSSACPTNAPWYDMVDKVCRGG